MPDIGSVVAIVVARKGSRRIPGKAHEQINGEGLVARKLRQLAKVERLARVILGSDDESLRPAADQHGATFVRRPPEVCDEARPGYAVGDMIRHMLSLLQCEADTVLWAHPTNPMVTADHYRGALEAYAANGKAHDSLASVTCLRGHYFTSDGCPINWWPGQPHQVAADLQPVIGLDGAIFVRPHWNMALDGRFVGDSPLFYALDGVVGWDVNEPWELEVARVLAARETL